MTICSLLDSPECISPLVHALLWRTGELSLHIQIFSNRRLKGTHPSLILLKTFHRLLTILALRWGRHRREWFLLESSESGETPICTTQCKLITRTVPHVRRPPSTGNACLFSQLSLDEKCTASLNESLLRVNSYILLQVFEGSNPESLPLL